MNISEYKEILEPHRRALSQIELDLNFFLTDQKNINVFNIASRLKSFDSAIQKNIKYNINIEDLDDLAGLRIIVGTKGEIKIIERFFTRQIDSDNIVILKRHKLNKKSGYRALHLVIKLKANHMRSFTGGRVEVQLQTIFGNAFNNLSHSWVYKSNISTSESWDEKFIELSKALNHLENLAEELHSEIAELDSCDESSVLTLQSYILITKQEFNEEISYQDATDSHLFYTSIGYKTNGDLRRFYRNKKVNELYSFFTQISHESEALKILSGLGKTGFWGIFGTRIDYPGIKEFLRSTAKQLD